MKNHTGGYFHFTIKDKHNRVKAKFTRKNGVTDWAKELMLTNALTGSWYIGLIRTFNAADPNIRVPPFDPIVLNSLGFQEYTRYTGSRKAWDFSIFGDTASANSPAVFQGFNEAMNPMAGAFLAQSPTKGSGYSTVFAWSTGGSIVTLDDIVEVEYSITL